MLIDDEENVGCLDLGHHPVRHGQSQTARMRKEAYGPTKLLVSLVPRRRAFVRCIVLQFLEHRLALDAYCASRGRHHLHHDDSHIRQKRICRPCEYAPEI